MGAAAWLPGAEYPLAVYCEVPDRIRTLWARLADKSDYKDIYF